MTQREGILFQPFVSNKKLYIYIYFSKLKGTLYRISNSLKQQNKWKYGLGKASVLKVLSISGNLDRKRIKWK